MLSDSNNNITTTNTRTTPITASTITSSSTSTSTTTSSTVLCDRRLSRAGRFIIQKHYEQAFAALSKRIITSSSSSSSSSFLLRLYGQSDELITEQSLWWLWRIWKSKRRKQEFTILSNNGNYWELRNNVIKFLMIQHNQQHQQQQQQKEQEQRQENQEQQHLEYSQKEEVDRSKCPLLYGADIYEQDEIDTKIRLWERLGAVYNAIPGQRTKPPHRHAHKYRYSNKKKKKTNKNTVYTSNNNNVWLSPLDRTMLLQQNIIKHPTSFNRINYNPWYYSLSTNKTFLSRYYLDSYMDNRRNTSSIAKDDNNDAYNDNLICPSTDWCGTIIPLHVCYDTALFLEPYYGRPDIIQQQVQHAHTNNNNNNNNNIDPKKIRRMYQKAADQIARKCTIHDMNIISHNCQTMIQSCFGGTTSTSTNNTTANDTENLNLFVYNYLVQSLCTNVPTCHGRLHRLLHNDMEEYYNNRFGTKYYYPSSLWDSSSTGIDSTINFSFISIVIIILLFIYYIVLFVHHIRHPTTTNTSTTVLLLSSTLSSSSLKKQQSSTKQQQGQGKGKVQKGKQTKTKKPLLDDITTVTKPLTNDIYEIHHNSPMNNNRCTNTISISTTSNVSLRQRKKHSNNHTITD